MTSAQITCLCAFIGALVFVFRSVNLAVLADNSRIQHVIFGATASLFVLWLFRTGIHDGLSVHFLWLTAMALTLGLRWAILGASIALLGVTIVGLESWSMLGVNGLLGVILPLCFSYLVFTLVFHKLPRHLFVYIFVCAFFPGAATIAFKMALFAGYYSFAEIYSWREVYDNYLILTPLMLFPEAMLNGMTITLLTIYKPQWLYTFHDKFYLDK